MKSAFREVRQSCALALHSLNMPLDRMRTSQGQASKAFLKFALPLGKSEAHHCLCQICPTESSPSTRIRAQPGGANLPQMEHSSMPLNAPQWVTPQGRINEREEQFGIAHFCVYLESNIEPVRCPHAEHRDARCFGIESWGTSSRRLSRISVKEETRCKRLSLT